LPDASVVGSLPQGTLIAQEASDNLQTLIKIMLKYSTNLTAEITGLATTRKRGSSARNLAGSAREMTAWMKIAFGVHGGEFVDHSGLGEDSRISAAEMVQVLSRAGWNGVLRPVLKDIRLANARGKAAPIDGVSVVAKTGTLNFASALAGYISTPNGRKLAFAIFTADIAKRAKIRKSDRENPAGTATWVKRSKVLQQKLLRHWALDYGVS
jgi:D-alanyl-D-alanine carboxypeptidase/D-alanyl-D-alanine-endopeptidase (penicillin-binding protein 4)